MSITKQEFDQLHRQWDAGGGGDGVGSSGNRVVLLADTTYQVSTAGNDANNGTTQPWLTLQHAVNWIADNVDAAGHVVTIQIAAGSHGGCQVVKYPLNCVDLIILGNQSNPSSVILSDVYAAPWGSQYAAMQVEAPTGWFDLKGVTLHATQSANDGFALDSTCSVNLTDVRIIGDAGQRRGAAISNYSPGGAIVISNSFSISNDWYWGFDAESGTQILCWTSVALNGTPNFAYALANAMPGSTVSFQGFTGTATGKKFQIDNGTIKTGTNDLNYLPGNTAGTYTAGLYDGLLLGNPIAANAGAREVVSANRNYYVNGVTGLDSNTGLSSAAPLKTVQAAVNKVAAIDVVGVPQLQINVADGFYNEDVYLTDPNKRDIQLLPYLVGNAADPFAVTIKSVVCGWNYSTTWQLDNIAIKAAGGLNAYTSAYLNFGTIGIVFEGGATSAAIWMNQFATLQGSFIRIRNTSPSTPYANLFNCDGQSQIYGCCRLIFDNPIIFSDACYLLDGGTTLNDGALAAITNPGNVSGPLVHLKTMSSFRSPTMPGLWPGPDGTIEDGCFFNGFVGGGTVGRQIITANYTAYVSPTGSDSNPGTSALPFKTPEKGIAHIAYDLDVRADVQITLQLADGVQQNANDIALLRPLWADTNNWSKNPPIFRGNPSNPDACIIGAGAGVYCGSYEATNWIVDGVTAGWFGAYEQSTLTLGNITLALSAANSGGVIDANFGARIEAYWPTPTWKITNSSPAQNYTHILHAGHGSFIDDRNLVLNLANSIIVTKGLINLNDLSGVRGSFTSITNPSNLTGPMASVATGSSFNHAWQAGTRPIVDNSSNWIGALGFVSIAGAPTTANLPDGTHGVFKNTTTGLLGSWANDGGAITAIGGGGATGGRTILAADTTYNISATGSDTTGDGSAGAPWATMQHAVDWLARNVDLADHYATLNVGSGSFAGLYNLSTVGTDRIIVLGQGSALTRITPNAKNTGSIYSTGHFTQVNKCTIECNPAAYSGLYFDMPVELQVGDFSGGTDLVFDGVGSGAVGIGCYGAATVLAGTGTINVKGNYAVFAELWSCAVQNYGAWAMVGTPAFSSAFVTLMGGANWSGGSISGAATGKRFIMWDGIVYTGSATYNPNFFPGDVPGTGSGMYDGILLGSFAANSHLNFGTTFGASGYGLRDDGGVIEYKHSGGAWTSLSAVTGGSGSPAGPSGAVQYNGASAFAGQAGFMFDGANAEVVVGGDGSPINGSVHIGWGNTPNCAYLDFYKGGAAPGPTTLLADLGWSTTDFPLTLSNGAKFIISGGPINVAHDVTIAADMSVGSYVDAAVYELDLNAANTHAFGIVTGSRSYAKNHGSGTFNYLRAIEPWTFSDGASHISNMVGVDGLTELNNAAGSVDNMVGISSWAGSDAGTISVVKAFFAGVWLGTGTATETYSYYSAVPEYGSKNYAFYSQHDAKTAPQESWAFYGKGTAPSFFGGPVAVGDKQPFTDSSTFDAIAVIGTNAAVSHGSPNLNFLWGLGTIPSWNTGTFQNIKSEVGTAAAAFTLANLVHFEARFDGLGAGSAVTNQFGYRARNSLVGATNNYGFYGDLPAAVGNWNFYGNGTARSWFGGNVGVAAGKYINFGTTDDSAGYGFRDNGGNIQWKNATGAWADITAGGGGGAASSITFTPTGGVAATNVQAAIAEVDTEKAPLASPVFTGNPTAPTPAANDNDTSIATTAFVIGQASATLPVMNGSATAGVALTWARGDHVHPVDTSRAPLASPTFTGTPAAPNAALNTNTTQIATTAFVLGQVSTTTPTMNGTAAIGTGTTFARADHVHPSDTTKLSTNVTATLTVGYTFTPNNLGTMSGTVTPNPALGNYQYGTINSAITIAAPASDCAIDILITNGGAAATPTFSGYTAPAGGGGDTYATTNAAKFILSIRRINAIATYSWKALQ